MPHGEGELFKDKVEVSLDGRQIFYLFFGGAVIACMVFVLGVMVGRQVEARAYLESGAGTRATLDPLAALDQLETGDRTDPLVFPRALRGGGEEMLSLGRLDEKLAFAEVTEAGKAEAERAEAQRPEQPAAKDDRVDPAAPEEEKAPRPEEAGATSEKAEASRKAKPDPEPAEANFTLQLSSFQDEEEARAFVAELKHAGYQPYVSVADVPERGRWYRVRLGYYDSYKDALRAKEEFERRKRIIAYVTRLQR